MSYKEKLKHIPIFKRKYLQVGTKLKHPAQHEIRETRMFRSAGFGRVALVTPNAILFHKKHGLLQVVFKTPFYVCLFNIDKKQLVYCPHGRMQIFEYKKMDERFCLKCLKWEPLDNFINISAYCKKFVRNEADHRKFFKQTPYYDENFIHYTSKEKAILPKESEEPKYSRLEYLLEV